MYPTLFTTPGVKDFAEAVDTERQAQLAKWGDQHHPDMAGTDDVQEEARRMFARFAANYQTLNSGEFDPRDPDASVDWTGILLEEVYEAVSEKDPAKLRTELIQVAAVCAAWVHDLNTRPHPMICDHCGEPIPTGTGLNTWHGPIPKPGQPECTVPRYHLGREYPECRAAGGEQPPAADSQVQR
jgi:hypothetical protein